jgi:predicted permease
VLPAARWRRAARAPAIGAGRRSTADRRARRTRRVFLAGQIALAVAVTSSAALLVQGFRSLLATPTGFRSNGVVTLRVALPRARYASEDRARALLGGLIEALRGDPVIRSVGAVSSLPLESATPSGRLEIEGRAAEPDARLFDADVLAASAGYFETLGIPAVAGRGIAETDAASALPVAVINRTLANRFFPGESAVGRRLRLSGAPEWRTIVGVVGDVWPRSLEQPPRQALFLPIAQADPAPRSVALVVDSPGGAGSAAAAARRVLARLDPEIPVFAVEEMRRHVSDSLAGRRLAALLLLLLTVAAIGLAALGTSAVAAYDVVQRRREIGIRMTLGARPRRIAREVLGESLRTAATGIAAGIVVAVAAGRVLATVLSGSTASPLAVASGAAALAGAAVLASWLPARRAAETDPAISIRGE